MTIENVCMMYVPRSAACSKKFLSSCGFGEQGLRNIIQRTHEMLQEEQGKRNKRSRNHRGREKSSGTSGAALSLVTGGTGPALRALVFRARK